MIFYIVSTKQVSESHGTLSNNSITTFFFFLFVVGGMKLARNEALNKNHKEMVLEPKHRRRWYLDTTKKLHVH